MNGDTVRQKNQGIAPLPRTFYIRDALAVARNLIGCFFVHESPEGITAGMITETEAYLTGDPASHAFQGMTKRNRILFGPAGHAYVYQIYGIHHCLNAVAGEDDGGEAVLLRALAPVEGISLMMERRRCTNIRNLCSGPGKLAQAMGIDIRHNGCPLYEGALTIRPWKTDGSLMAGGVGWIRTSTRIGITRAMEKNYRFTLESRNGRERQE